MQQAQILEIGDLWLEDLPRRRTWPTGWILMTLKGHVMPGRAVRFGRDYLKELSRLAAARRAFPALSDLAIISGDERRTKLLQAVIHALLGYDAKVRTARTLGLGLDLIIAEPPLLILLDDQITPQDTAQSVIPILRRCGYNGAIVALAVSPSPVLERALIAAGADDVIDRDELSAVRLGAALAKSLQTRPS